VTAAGEGGEGEGGRLREMSGHRRPGRSAGSARTQHSAGEQAEMEQLLAMTARNARPHMAARRTASPGRKHGQVSNRLARMRLRILYAVCHVRCRSRPSSHEASCPRCIDFIDGCAVRRATLCCTGAPRCVACAIQQGFLHCANMARVQQATANPLADSNDSRRRRRLSTARLAASSCRRMSWRCSRSSRTCGRATPSCVYAAWACYVVHAM
jgi:hypothetical protein